MPSSFMNVLKASGLLEPYSEEKVRASLERIGVGQELQERVLEQLHLKLYEGISTEEIYRVVHDLLQNLESPSASKYGLRRAIMDLGPSGFPFEKYVAGLLEFQGYQVTIGQILRGKCISHEVDIVAQKDRASLMVECKYHNQVGGRCDAKNALYTYARFLDLQNVLQETNGKTFKFSQAWLVTNTKVTTDVIAYGQCVGMKILSWNYPAGEGLASLIEKSGLYPVTVLNTLSPIEKARLLEEGIVFAKDLLEGQNGFLKRESLDNVKRELVQFGL